MPQHRASRGGFYDKQARASQAQKLIRETIPALLASDARAAHGVASAQLLRGSVDLPSLAAPVPVPAPDSRAATAPNPTAVETPTADQGAARLQVRIVAGDTLEVAHAARLQRPTARIAVLNMASPLHPGGGVLRGATAQEETLCMRSTLYASLRDEWYRLPEDGVVWTEDVLVFGTLETGGRVTMLDRQARWYVDVVSCAAVRKPEVVPGPEGDEYEDPRDEERMALKIRYIMRACVLRGAKVVVLGALGCGAYHNPVAKVAALMRKCLLGRSGYGPAENWTAAGIEEVVFAILDETPAKKVWGPFVKEFEGREGVTIHG